MDMYKDFFYERLRKDHKEWSEKFFLECAVLVVPVCYKLIDFLSVEEYLDFFSQLEKIVSEDYLLYVRGEVNLAEPIHVCVPVISLYEYLNAINPYYITIINTYSWIQNCDWFCFVFPYGKINNVEVCKNKLADLFDYFNLTIAHSENDDINKSVTDLFCISKLIYPSYIANNIKNEKFKEIKKSVSIPDKKQYSLKDSYTVGEFKREIEGLSSEIRTVEGVTKLVYGLTSFYKDLREEYLIIYSYVKSCCIDDEVQILLGKKQNRWDAMVGSKCIEVTQAVYQDEYLVRQSMCCLGGYSGLSLDLKTKDQLGKDKIISIILNSIKIKAKKYSDGRILIVATQNEFFEVFENSRYGYNKVISYLQETLKFQTDFSEIYLALDEKLVKIY